MWQIVFMLVGSNAFSASLAEWNSDGYNLNGGFASHPNWYAANAAEGVDAGQAVAKLDETKFSASYYADTARMTYKLQNIISMDTSRYIEVFIAPGEDRRLSITNISFNLYTPDTGSGHVAVRSSLDAFSSDIAVEELTLGGNNRVNVDLSSFSGFSRVDSLVEFRIYLWGATGAQTAWLQNSSGGNSIQIDGAVVLKPLAEWNSDGYNLNGGFASHPNWYATNVVEGVDAGQAVAKLDETKFSASYYADTARMTYKLQNTSDMDTNRYIQVFIAPDADRRLSITSISLSLYSSAAGAGHVAVRSSLDAFGSDIAVEELILDSNNRVNVDFLSFPEFNSVGSCVEFRIYLWGAAGAQTAWLQNGSEGNSIQIDGTTDYKPNYSNWIQTFSVGDATNYTDNADGDRLDNLSEYALGGDPGNPDDSPSIFPMFGKTQEGEFMEYVYRRRSDYETRGLGYSVELTDNLISNVWESAVDVEVGIGTVDEGFESVTNRIPMVGKSRQMIRLLIEME
ncbi:hypothetical protein [Tichowtungia aerotolerans]|uniref:Uncharacterized protein n=1 Tax=Tichowtungia aerotolerans TaxID=2697043 RepID=A0A6P1M919_9BACT|nr:hypothetical protein [Tichowtungia aerotolerans]QHI70387.1 hypothetical protein GT409_13360 [Tichowtungia aerotolerans]